MKLSGAQILIKSLIEEGVDTIFGYPGGAVLPIYDALYDSDLRHILTRHEQGAIHAADGYARATGRPGVCIATSGPGATNLVTGLANAYMDSVPLVAFTGQVVRSMLGRDAFQEADITGITQPITKHNYLVKDAADMAEIVHKAFHIATTGRPGPVLVDIPKDVSAEEVDYTKPGPISLRGYKPTVKGNIAAVNRAAKAIMQSERPVIYAGGGVINANANDKIPVDFKYDVDGFAVNGSVPGIYAAGCVRKPGDVATSVQDATAAVIKALQAIVVKEVS